MVITLRLDSVNVHKQQSVSECWWETICLTVSEYRDRLFGLLVKASELRASDSGSILAFDVDPLLVESYQ